MNSKTTPTITLDTNVIQEYWLDRPKVYVVRRLLDLSDSGQLDLAVTSRIESDVPRPPLAERINELPTLGVKIIQAPSLINVSWDYGKLRYTNSETVSFLEDIANRFRAKGMRKKSPDVRDLCHLDAHYTSGRSVFLTWDKGIIHIAECLENELGIVVMKPEDYLDKE